MNTAYFIAGSVFIVLSIIWAIYKKSLKRNKEYEKAIKDLDEAVDNHDWDAIDDARHRMWKNK